MENQIEFLRKLIKTRSLSGEEKAVGGLIKRKMNQLDYDRVKTDLLGNVIGLIGDGTPQLTLETHMDTVEAGDESNWELDPFSGEIRAGKVHGRGSVDMSVGFGPGDEPLAHQPDERISIEELQLATEGYEEFIGEFFEDG